MNSRPCLSLRALAAAVAVAWAGNAAAATPPARPSPAAVPAGPIRIQTAPLTATGLGKAEAPFSLKVTTQVVSAQGLGTAEPPFRPLVVKTDALTAQGRSDAPGGPK